ncbi:MULTISPECIES: hypothetical protein [Streptomyces]|uniref:Lipoprotein n=1 Tax=Streptomyces eurythermus TaxID=42237 RepID=A0ABW6YXE8_9ACTN|nr:MULTISPECIES: hypothetical protein [Streptomyces]QIS72782.1 hypothetical protein HB370_24705 [Streptomyces sp. DSM 40868]
MAHNRKQLRSGTVVLGGVGLLAAALTACSSDPDKRCVDRDSYDVSKGYKVVSDKDCKTTGGTGVSSSGRKKPVKKGAKRPVDAAWYYEGKEKNGWVDGGSFTKPGGSGGSSGGSSYNDGNSGGSNGGVSRGGFGGGSGSSGG